MGLDGICSTFLAELNLGYLPTLTLGALNGTWNLVKDFFGSAIDFAEGLVV